MTIFDQLRARREEILATAAIHGADCVRVFGSVARGEETENSDIDLVVRMQAGRSLLDLAGLKHDIEDLIQRPADIVTENSLHPLIRNKILGEARPL